MSKKFPILEVFGPTLSGEGASIGVQTMFVRFGGCDYRCGRCDSLHAVLPELIKKNAKYMDSTQIFAGLLAASRHPDEPGHCRTVTFSGGNPCMWDLSELVTSLNEDGWTILVETQGTLWQDWLLDCTAITVSPKGPGMEEKFEEDKFKKFLKYFDHNIGMGISPEVCVKIVIFDQRDIEFAKQIAYAYPGLKHALFLSLGNPWPPEPAHSSPLPFGDPVKEIMSFSDAPSFSDALLKRMKLLWEQIKQEPLLRDARFLPQLHVLLWDNERGR